MKNGAEKRKRSILCRIGAAALCVLLGGFILLRSLPVSWDAGACGGGYAANGTGARFFCNSTSRIGTANTERSQKASSLPGTASGLIPTIGANRFDSKQTAEEGAFQFGYAGWRENK